jgi:hypothetical protein
VTRGAAGVTSSKRPLPQWEARDCAVAAAACPSRTWAEHVLRIDAHGAGIGLVAPADRGQHPGPRRLLLRLFVTRMSGQAAIGAAVKHWHPSQRLPGVTTLTRTLNDLQRSSAALASLLWNLTDTPRGDLHRHTVLHNLGC